MCADRRVLKPVRCRVKIASRAYGGTLKADTRAILALRAPVEQGQEAAEALTGYDINANGTIAAHIPRKTFVQAAAQIIVADVSMSLDNVLAVAGAAREHPVVLIFGLALSIG